MVLRVTAKPHVATKNFDPLKLEAMNEPLAVRVEKKKGNVRTMIPLPAGDDGAPQGANYSKEDVRALEQWLVTEWAGGGYYVITVNDSSVPVPQKMEWEIYYDLGQYPEKTPPTLMAAVSDRVVAPTPTPHQPPQVRYMAPSAFPNGFPLGMPVAPAQSYSPTWAQWQAPQYPATQLMGSSAYNPQAEAEKRRYEEQLRSVETQLAKAREEALAAQHRQDLERARAEQNERMSKLEQMFTQFVQTQQNARPAVDPALEAMKEANRMLEARLDAEKREREAERRENELKEQIRRHSEETQAKFEALIASQQQNKGLDPLILMMQENTRQQAEASREQARQFTAQMAQLSGFMMNPRDIMLMAKESSNGLDNATRSIAGAYESILAMNRQAVEQILQLQNTGGSETIGLIREGMERAAGFAEKYIGGKVKEATVGQQSQAQIATAQATHAQAQAQAMHAQVQAQALAAQAAARAGQQVPPAPGQPHTPAPNAAAAQPRAGANGAANGVHPVTAQAGPSGETLVSQTSSAPLPANDAWGTSPVPSVTAGPESKVKRHLGHTDEEWFGEILPHVQRLREGVARFIESLQQTPPRLLPNNHVDGVEPAQASNAILQVAMMVMQRQMPILAMTDLLDQGRVADCMDVLLPDAPQPYRDEVAQKIIETMKGEDEDPDDLDDPDDGGGDDGDDGDDAAHEAQPPAQLAVVKAPPAKPSKPASRPARA
jgi:hypothetical protein